MDPGAGPRVEHRSDAGVRAAPPASDATPVQRRTFARDTRRTVFLTRDAMVVTLPSGLELLLKYRPALYGQGKVAFDAARPVIWTVLVVAAVVATAVVWTYRHVGSDPVRGVRRASPRDRALLIGLRLATLAVLVVLLMRPVLVLSAAVPKRNTVAILVDDSRSMRVRDWNGRPRADFARTALADAAPLRRALAEQFGVRLYRFSDLARRVDSVGGLQFAGDRTRLGASLDRVRAELDGVPLAGVVIVSDGADGAPTALADAALALRARGTPVFTVGVGSEATARDVEVREIEAPRTALRGSTVAVDVVLAHHGMPGDSVAVIVEENGRTLARHDVRLPTSGDAVPVRVTVPLAEGGPHRLTARVPQQPGEAVVENNARTALVDVRDEVERVLYFEGEPRFEMKFLRRAVADDSALRVAVLQRTADGKYLRLGVEDSLDLLGGFPTSRDVLFKYRAIILGSVEASAFSADQLRLISDFVSVRGGSLVLLGGRRAFAEGGYAGTPLEELMPVVLERLPTKPAPDAPATELAIHLTPAGAAHVPLQLAADEQKSAARWKTLPPLTAVNTVRAAKPGATVLATGTTKEGASRVALAYQRYGRGKVVALPVQDDWLWQMHASMPVDDMTHELFWRQMLRWLTADLPERIAVTASADQPAPGEPVTLRAEVRDSHYVAVNGAAVVATVMAPNGTRTAVPLEWNVRRDGEYAGVFTPNEAGRYEVTVSAAAKECPPALLPSCARAVVDAAESREEYFQSAMRAPLLKQLADETGGRFYTPATVGSLPEDLRYARGGVTTTERKELWDTPLAFLLLGALLAGEWVLRRRRGLA